MREIFHDGVLHSSHLPKKKNIIFNTFFISVLAGMVQTYSTLVPNASNSAVCWTIKLSSPARPAFASNRSLQSLESGRKCIDFENCERLV